MNDRKVYAVFSYGDPMPITVCATDLLARSYAEALSRLPEGHPLRTTDAVVDEVPFIEDGLPLPLRDPEAQVWPPSPGRRPGTPAKGETTSVSSP